MTSSNAVIWIVEDDAVLAESLRILFLSAGLPQMTHFASAEQCLEQVMGPEQVWRDQVGCVLLDIRLQGQSGTALFAELKNRQWPWPVIFMTGHADVQVAVDLLRQGAFDFVTKPCDPMALIGKIKEALATASETLNQDKFQREHLKLLLTLTPHERFVFKGILAHLSNREIADQMHNSTRTIETHRAKIFKKMKVVSAIELAQIQERFILQGGDPPF